MVEKGFGTTCSRFLIGWRWSSTRDNADGRQRAAPPPPRLLQHRDLLAPAVPRLADVGLQVRSQRAGARAHLGGGGANEGSSACTRSLEGAEQRGGGAGRPASSLHLAAAAACPFPSLPTSQHPAQAGGPPRPRPPTCSGPATRCGGVSRAAAAASPTAASRALASALVIWINASMRDCCTSPSAFSFSISCRCGQGAVARLVELAGVRHAVGLAWCGVNDSTWARQQLGWAGSARPGNPSCPHSMRPLAACKPRQCCPHLQGVLQVRLQPRKQLVASLKAAEGTREEGRRGRTGQGKCRAGSKRGRGSAGVPSPLAPACTPRRQAHRRQARQPSSQIGTQPH